MGHRRCKDSICPSRAENAAAPRPEEGRQVPEVWKPQRPSASASEARRPQVTSLRVAPLGEVREVVPCLVSLPQPPHLFPPFGLPPSCSREGGGSSQGLRSFLEEVPRLLPLHSGGCDWVPLPIHFPPAPFPGGAQVRVPLSGKERSLHQRGDRKRGWSSGTAFAFDSYSYRVGEFNSRWSPIHVLLDKALCFSLSIWLDSTSE
jgi:hypothetical protein